MSCLRYICNTLNILENKYFLKNYSLIIKPIILI